MAIVGTYSVPGSETITPTNQYTTIDELLLQLPNNIDNLIVAKDIRDPVYTLWQRLNYATASTYFKNISPTPIKVGGIEAGTIFNSQTNMQDMWNLLLYPYTLPATSLNILGATLSYAIKEYGDSTGLATNSLTLNWSVSKYTNNITSILVHGQVITPTGSSQSGTKLTNGTHSVTPSFLEINTFTMSVSDGVNTVYNTTQLYWMNRIYWGKVDLSSIGEPNLTLSPTYSAMVASVCTDSVINNLTGAGVGTGDQLAISKSFNYDGIDAMGDYLIFAWPSSMDNATTPIFKVNGMISNAFTNVRTASPFINQHGFSVNYEVWVSNTPQNSPISLLTIT